MTNKDLKNLFWYTFAFVVILTILYLFNLIDLVQAIEILLTFTLVTITAVYVRRTAEIAKANEKQAEASLKMAEEMKDQILSESQPYLLIRLEDNITRRYISADNEDPIIEDLKLIIRNEGKGPAINIWVGLWSPLKTFVGERKEYLAFGEEWKTSIRQKPLPLLKENTMFLKLKNKITNYYPEPIVVKYEDIHRRTLISCLYFNWHPDLEGCIIAGDQCILELE